MSDKELESLLDWLAVDNIDLTDAKSAALWDKDKTYFKNTIQQRLQARDDRIVAELQKQRHEDTDTWRPWNQAIDTAIKVIRNQDNE